MAIEKQKMKTDLINAIFEVGGAILTWKNAHRLWKDREIKGVYWPAWVFFALWGWWNCFYYPSLDQWFSFAAGLALVLGNTAWCVLALIVWTKNRGRKFRCAARREDKK